MARLRYFAWIIGWLGAPLLLSAQYTFQVHRYTTENGIPSNGIKGMQWDDRTGFLWIATEAGVARYNGEDFVIFSKGNTPGFRNERMLMMSKDRQGRIFTVTEAGDIFFVMENRLQLWGHTILDTRPSTAKLIGIASSLRLFRQSDSQPPRNFGFNFFSDQSIPLNDSVILLLHKDSLFRYSLGKTNPEWLHSAWPEGRLFLQADKIFAFSKSHRFFELDPTGNSPKPVPFVDEANILRQAGSNPEYRLFWEAGMENPILIAGSSAWLIQYKADKIMASLICGSIPTDTWFSSAKFIREKNMLFLGTGSKGIIVIRKNQVMSVKNSNNPDKQLNSCYSQIALPNGSILTSNGYVLGNRDDHSGPLPIKTSFNNFVYLGKDSTLWYSRQNTINSYSYKTHVSASFPAGEGYVTTGFIQSANRLFIANSIGIGTMEDGRVSYLYRHPQADNNSNAPFAMIELEPGVLAIACCNGLLRFNTRTLHLDTLLTIPGICIRALCLYKGYLFIGSYGKGIYILKNGLLKPIPIDKNEYLQYAHCFIIDWLGYCWISTNRGLFKARPEDMVRAYEKPQEPLYYHYYGAEDGMEMTELNGGCTPCALALNDSTLSFPSMDGLIWVDPRASTQVPRGEIYIDALEADGKKISVESLTNMELPAHTRELILYTGFPAWGDQENIYIEYKLLPYSDEWQLLKVQNDPSVRFSNLPSGDYHLILRKINGFGYDNFNTREIRFRIAQPWYQHWGTRIAGLLALIAMVMLIIKLRTRQFQIRQLKLEEQIAVKTNELMQKNEELEKTDQIKTRLISIISHDLVTPLKFLHLTGRSILEKKGDMPEELQTEMVTEITHTSKQLELLSTNILNWIKYRNEDRRLEKERFQLRELVDLIFGILGSMAKQKQIRLVNEVEEDLVLHQYIEPVKIVFYNLVLNAINFTREGGGGIIINDSITAEGILIRVRDEGVGMSPEQINNIMADHFIISSANVDNRKGNGLGYLIIKDLLKIIKGSLSLESELTKGTIVSILIQIEPAIH